MRLLVLFFLAIVLTSAAARAGVTFRLIYLEAPADAPKSMHLFDGRKSQEVKLPKMNLSPVYELRRGTKELYLLAAPPARKGDLPADAPSVAIDKGISDFILLVRRETKSDGGEGEASHEGGAEGEEDEAKVLTLTVIEVDPAKVKEGGMLWCNLTDKHIEGTLGDTELKLGPHARVPVQVSAGEGESFPVNLSFRVPGEDSVRPLSETSWVRPPRSRIIQFVFEQRGSIVPRLMGVADNR